MKLRKFAAMTIPRMSILGFWKQRKAETILSMITMSGGTETKMCRQTT